MNRKKVPKGKIVRRFGVNIFGNPKYDKLLKKKPAKPGPTTGRKRRARLTEYGKHLIEKQKLKMAFGVSEKQMVNLYKEAKRVPGVTGHNILFLLERRLDNVVHRLGLAQTRPQARKMISDGHIEVDSQKVDIPSYRIKVGQSITLGKRDAVVKQTRARIQANSAHTVPSWLSFSPDELKGQILNLPERDHSLNFVDEQLVVEYYAR